MKKKYFLLTLDISDEDLQYIASQKGLSIEQVTDGILASCIQEGMIDSGFEEAEVTPDLTHKG